jgi:transposase InsO family protein
MCHVLELSRSSFYAWQQGKTHVQSTEKQAVGEQVKSVFETHKRRYGTRRIEAELKDSGVQVGRYQVRKRMQEQGLKAIQPRSFVPKTTQTNPNLQRSPNLLLEMDSVSGMDEVWVGDITYLPMADKSWTYLATWMDLNSRMIVGWQISESLEASIAIDSIKKAIQRRGPKAGLIVHTDGGGQYMDQDFRQILKDNRYEQSMTRVDNHYDNAFAESLFSRFKAELMNGMVFEDLKDAKAKTFEYIEIYYNRKRRHSSIGYTSPETFESNWRQHENCQRTKINMQR